jgi:hypothetical protein
MILMLCRMFTTLKPMLWYAIKYTLLTDTETDALWYGNMTNELIVPVWCGLGPLV